jgi:hypothetical protein
LLELLAMIAACAVTSWIRDWRWSRSFRSFSAQRKRGFLADELAR